MSEVQFIMHHVVVATPFFRAKSAFECHGGFVVGFDYGLYHLSVGMLGKPAIKRLEYAGGIAESLAILEYPYAAVHVSRCSAFKIY